MHRFYGHGLSFYLLQSVNAALVTSLAHKRLNNRIHTSTITIKTKMINYSVYVYVTREKMEA